MGMTTEQIEKSGKYRFKIELPENCGEPLFTNDFNAAVEIAKEYGKGTKVTPLERN